MKSAIASGNPLGEDQSLETGLDTEFIEIGEMEGLEIIYRKERSVPRTRKRERIDPMEGNDKFADLEVRGLPS